MLIILSYAPTASCWRTPRILLFFVGKAPNLFAYATTALEKNQRIPTTLLLRPQLWKSILTFPRNGSGISRRRLHPDHCSVPIAGNRSKKISRWEKCQPGSGSTSSQCPLWGSSTIGLTTAESRKTMKDAKKLKHSSKVVIFNIRLT